MNLAGLLDQDDGSEAWTALLRTHRETLRRRIAELQLSLAITDYRLSHTLTKEQP